ncbi:MAG: hypothetical protein RR954_07575 [Christensenellaceae bacterium]
MKKIATCVLLLIIMLTFQACRPANTSSEFDFINEFNLFEVGDGYDNSKYVELSDQQQIRLKEILDAESWKLFTETLERGFSTTLILINENNDCIYFNSYNDEALILIKFSEKPNETISYTTNIDLINKLTLFQEDLIK